MDIAHAPSPRLSTFFACLVGMCAGVAIWSGILRQRDLAPAAFEMPKASIIQLVEWNGGGFRPACAATVIHRVGYAYDLLVPADCVSDVCYDPAYVGPKAMKIGGRILAQYRDEPRSKAWSTVTLVELTDDYATLRAHIPLELDAFFDPQP